jgi:hypothetical protein
VALISFNAAYTFLLSKKISHYAAEKCLIVKFEDIFDELALRVFYPLAGDENISLMIWQGKKKLRIVYVITFSLMILISNW